MEEHVCPVWVGYLLASPVRKLFHNPGKILKPYIRPGMVVLDVGCAMGFFSLPMAEWVKPDGKVVCSDMQEKMIRRLEKRAGKAGLSDWIETHLCGRDSLGLEAYAGKIDLAFAFYVLHEVPDQSGFLAEIGQVLNPSGRLLLAEPKGHVKQPDFDASVALAEEANFAVLDRPRIPRSLTVLLEQRKSNG